MLNFHKTAFLIIFSYALTAQAQDTNKEKQADGTESRSEMDKIQPNDYLELVHYTKRAELLKKTSISDIRALSVIVKNFGDKVPGSKEALEAIKQDYKIGLRYYYRRAGFHAGKKMEAVDAKIKDLYQKFSNYYETRTDELLTQCADAIVTIQENEEINAVNSSTQRILQTSEHKLRFAYFQMSMADKFNRDARFRDSLLHYRNAKEYGISLLQDLVSDEAEKKKVLSDFKIDLVDNKNQVYSATETAPAATNP